MRWILESHPGTQVLSLKVFEGAESFESLQKQSLKVAKVVKGLEDKPGFSDGFVLMCHSQGAVTCRSICEHLDGHKVHTLISLAGPQMGVFGNTWLDNSAPFLKSQLPLPDFPLPSITGIFPGLTDAYKQVYQIAYTPALQKTLAPANLWNDPLHQRQFLEGNCFLPELNGLVGTPTELQRRRSNFLRLQKAVFMVGSFDTPYDSPLGVEPWQTGVFGFYAPGSDTEILPMEQQDVYIHDTFGLRTLHESGRLTVKTVPGVRHLDWLTSKTVFEQHVLELLS